MTITLGPRSLSRLEGVHPDLVRVIKRCARDADPKDDFAVLEGVRSDEQMRINYGKGRTVAQCRAKGVSGRYAQPGVAKVTWLNDPLKSNHRRFADGFGRAADIVPYPIDWNDAARFKRLADMMKAAAAAEGVKMVHGIDWKKPDAPHHELPPA